MIPEYYQNLNPVMKELVLTLGIPLLLPPPLGIFRQGILGMHLPDLGVWVKMDHGLHGGPEVILLHEIGHWTGNLGRLSRPAITEYWDGNPPPLDVQNHEEAIAQYVMMLLAPALGILTEGEAHFQFYQYVSWAWDVTSVTESAHRAVGYIKMLAPHLFGQKPAMRLLDAPDEIPYTSRASGF